jgi:DNA-binding NtrC family response regulator
MLNVPVANRMPDGRVMEPANLDDIERDIACASRTHAPVLIVCRDPQERRRIAHAIHERSHRAQGPFIAVCCAGPRAALLEADLFGTSSNRFAGHDESGAIARADGGIVFLDDVGELSPPIQSLLSQFLATGDIQGSGAVNVRVITASSRSLFERVLTQEFREDLFYRLNVIHIRDPR